MIALRAPLAAVAGSLFSLAVFLGLWRLVDVPFDFEDVIEARTVVYTPQRRDTPIITKREDKIEREPPTLTPLPPGPTTTIDDPGTRTAVVINRVDPELPTTGIKIGGSDRDVLPLVRVQPDYPPRAATSGTEGWVRVRFTITATGTVRDAMVVESEPGTVFDDATLKAIARWRYNPRIDGGVAVERVGVETIIRFDLQD